jgi:hypothetical protein
MVDILSQIFAYVTKSNKLSISDNSDILKSSI